MEAEDRRRRPTKAQIDYLRELRAKADVDADYYLDRKPESMSRREVQDEIDRLRRDLCFDAARLPRCANCGQEVIVEEGDMMCEDDVLVCCPYCGVRKIVEWRRGGSDHRR